ncbi:uncharacterized protein LOC110988307 isoform X2 [Acanthaster planci]|nr:uncharacterized protein LOC110988307 isoform X2 [Acanthaster planci]
MSGEMGNRQITDKEPDLTLTTEDLQSAQTESGESNNDQSSREASSPDERDPSLTQADQAYSTVNQPLHCQSSQPMVAVDNQYTVLHDEMSSGDEEPSSRPSIPQPLRSQSYPYKTGQRKKPSKTSSQSTTSSRAPKLSPQSHQFLEKFHLRLACRECYDGKKCKSACKHQCRGNLLLCHLKSQSENGHKVWGVIRHRTRPDFKGQYQLCKNSRTTSHCWGKDCWYCHSEEEKYIWSAEQKGQFDRQEISEFLCREQNLQQNLPKLPPPPSSDTPDGFQVVSRRSTKRTTSETSTEGAACNSIPQKTVSRPVQRKNSTPIILSAAESRDEYSKLMAKVGGNFVYLCETCFDSSPPVMSKSSADGRHGTSKEQHPWSKVLVHVLQKDGKHQYLKIRKGARYKASLCRHIEKRFGCRRGDACQFAHNKVETEVWQCPVHQKDIVQFCEYTFIPRLPYRLMYVEDVPGVTSHQVVLYSDSRKEWHLVRERHPKFKPGKAPVLCRYGDHCRKYYCTYPHIPEEAELWTYMAKFNLRTLDEVISIAAIADSRQVANGTGASAPEPVRIQPFCCTYCDKHFERIAQLKDHLQTLGHLSRVDSDAEREWKHREPPWNLESGNYKLCEVVGGGTCLSGSSIGEDNSCTKAHSREELEEWKERYTYCMAKMKTAKERKLHSYMGDLLSMHEAGMDVFKEEVPGVEVECAEELRRCQEIESKAGSTVFPISWTFTIKAVNKKPLQEVGLLFPDPHIRFHLSRARDKHQVCSGGDLSDGSDTYRVQVVFSSETLGTFNQWVVFNFGSEPVLIRKLQVNVGARDMPIPSVPSRIPTEPWNNSNSQLVKYSDPANMTASQQAERNLVEGLQERYPYQAPHRYRDRSILSEELSCDNYKEVMHNVLYLEEKECSRKISKFATSSILKVASQVELPDGMHFAPRGYLFASIDLQQALIDDTVTSQIIIKSVHNILLKFGSTKKIYEAAIFTNQTFGNGTQHSMYVKLSPQCVADQQLISGTERDVTIQLQLDRTQFVFKHFAIDRLQHMDMVLPDPNKPQELPDSGQRWTDDGTNPRQDKIVHYITTYGGEGALSMPGMGPVLLCGPFGTGKTFTLATAVMETLTEQPESKMLICTHSNSAADLYITNYLHKFVQMSKSRQPDLKMIRIYATYRNISSIHHDVHDYLLQDNDGNIRLPSDEDIRAAQIVVTTLTTAVHLVSQTMQGCFSHILIDEAGQVLEAEALMPLAMATKDTCVVLAGDHIQMSPKIFSETVRSAGFDKSILERLFRAKACHVFLTANYRTCKPILDFIAKTFYNQAFCSKIDQPLHETLYPLMFIEVKGTDQRVGKSYVNTHEVLEVVRRVKELDQTWPAEWGPFRHESSIGVIAPCIMQVRVIRDALRKERLGHVTVETVDNVQGKQFRAVIISTVRTHKTLSKSSPSAGVLDEKDSEFYSSFFSDPKMLNTAFTRAQSQLIVVGDPAALCSVGSCSTKWRKYLKECEENQSLLPLGTTISGIHAEIRGASQRLNPNAVPFQPASYKKRNLPEDDGSEFNKASVSPQQGPDDQDGHSDTDSLSTYDDESDCEDDMLSELQRQVMEDEEDMREAAQQAESASKVHVQVARDEDDRVSNAKVHMKVAQGEGAEQESIAKVHQRWAKDGGAEQESIAKVHQRRTQDGEVEQESIAKVHQHRAQDGGSEQESIAKVHQCRAQDGGAGNPNPHHLKDQSVSKNHLLSSRTAILHGISDNQQANQEQAGPSKIQNTIQSQPVVKSDIQMKPGGSKTKGKKTTMIRADHLLKFKSVYRSGLVGAADYEDGADETEEEENLKMMDKESQREGLRLVERQPDKYKICSFKFEISAFAYAVPRGENSSKQVCINGRKNRGQALHLDEVVVEILEGDADGDLETTDACVETKIYGKVICILKRTTNPKRMKIVCTLDKYTDNLMVPVNHTFPKLYVISGKGVMKGRKTSGPSADFVPVSVFRSKRPHGQMCLERVVKVSRQDRQKKLFLVKYLKWEDDNRYPVGYVTEELPVGDNKEDGLLILKHIHGVRDAFPLTAIRDVESICPSDWLIPDEEMQSRKDFRRKSVFTVDHPETQDIDDALSIEVDNGIIEVGIHIADVSHFVPVASALDKEAMERAVSFYPAFSEPVGMLPPQLSTNLCSLLPGQDRLAVSVIFTMQQDGSISQSQFVLSVINSKKRVTFKEAEQMIMTSDHQQEGSIEEKIRLLSKLAQARRHARLSDGYLAYSHNPEEKELCHPLASSMVEEMMLIANEEVSKFLLSRFPDLTPLRSQLPPDEEKVTTWLNNHRENIPNSFYLQSDPTLQGKGECTNAHEDVNILKDTMKKLLAIIHLPNEASQKMVKITDIICSDENHPQLAVAQAELHHLQERATYISSGDYEDGQKRKHHTLKKPSYTHFTSPIRRYIDIVVHRLLKAELPNRGEELRPYASEDLSLICHHCTNQSIMAKHFEKETMSFHLALKLKETPHKVNAFVHAIGESSLQLMFPYRSFVPRTTQTVPYQHLSPMTKPDLTDATEVNLAWKMRIYDVNMPPIQSIKSPFKLDSEQSIVKIPSADMQKLLWGIKNNNFNCIQCVVKRVNKNHLQLEEDKSQHLKAPDGTSLPVAEIAQTVDSDGNPFPFTDFFRDFKQSDVVEVCLAVSISRGMIQPSVQHFKLTPKLGLCQEHRDEPAESFDVVASKRAVRCSTVEKYQNIWLPILEVMSVHNAVHSNESIFIQGLKINWDYDRSTGTWSGRFSLTASFCERWHIRFSFPNKSEESDKPDNEEMSKELEVDLDYLCISYTDLPLSDEAKVALREQQYKLQSSTDLPEGMVVTAHAAVTDVTRYKGNQIVHFDVKKLSSPFPKILLESAERFFCTVEVIPKQEQDRRLETAVRSLEKASPLIKDICLQRRPVGGLTLNLPTLAVTTETPFGELNESQQIAISHALKQAFTVIQGPPGTGKTIVGAKLTSLFVERNKCLTCCAKTPHVLYCGPSNESVNVVAGYLKRFHNLRVVRVYSETIERQKFPIPGDPVEICQNRTGQENKMDSRLDDIALHNLIRRPSNTHSEKIKEFDQLFSQPKYKASQDKIWQYRKEVAKAEEEELSKYEVILCTCNAAGSRRIRDNANVVQCIIDEAGMCSEPETLIPLVATGPEQIVLIGDHKQLRPIIKSKLAEDLGMGISMLENCKDSVHMLTTQYRMHESICKFPSDTFYKSRLETAEAVKQRRPELRGQHIWPGGPTFRNVFCHVQGREETLTVKAAEGNEMSKANPAEVEQVVKIVTSLILQCKIKGKRILVLSQYRLQCAKIKEKIREAIAKQKKYHLRRELKNVTVSTVITSQGGERDYVVFSTVRSLPRQEIEDKPTLGWKHRHLGFIMDDNQINVALTRARNGLIIVGNQRLLQVHSTLKELLDYYRRNGAVLNAHTFLRRMITDNQNQ